MDIKEIIKAWYKASNPSKEDLEIAEARLNICTECPNLKRISSIDLCGKCLCPINKKVFTDNKDSCPENKWEK